MNYPIQILKKGKKGNGYRYNEKDIFTMLGGSREAFTTEKCDKLMSDFLDNPYEKTLQNSNKGNELHKLELFHVFHTVLSRTQPIKHTPLKIIYSKHRYKKIDILWESLKKWIEKQEMLTLHSEGVLSDGDIQKINKLLQKLYDKYSDETIRKKMDMMNNIENIFISMTLNLPSSMPSFVYDGYEGIARILETLVLYENIIADASNDGVSGRGKHIALKHSEQKNRLCELEDCLCELDKLSNKPKSYFDKMRTSMKTIFKDSEISMRALLTQLQKTSQKYNLTHAYDYFTYVLETKNIKPKTGDNIRIIMKDDILTINGKDCYMLLGDLEDGVLEKFQERETKQ